MLVSADIIVSDGGFEVAISAGGNGFSGMTGDSAPQAANQVQRIREKNDFIKQCFCSYTAHWLFVTACTLVFVKLFHSSLKGTKEKENSNAELKALIYDREENE